jgi:transposase
MREVDQKQGMMFRYVSLEARVPEDHALRPMREMTDAALNKLSRRFSRMYAKTGRPSIAPEKLLRGLVDQARDKGLLSRGNSPWTDKPERGTCRAECG